MKKVLGTIAIITLCFGANAQMIDRGIGLRTSSGNDGIGVEASYAHAVSDRNKIEAGIGINTDSNVHGNSLLNFGAAYHWVNEFGTGFNWFAGPAVLFHISNKSAVGVGGQGGVGYNFKTELSVPVVAGFDVRPLLTFGQRRDMAWTFGIFARYILD